MCGSIEKRTERDPLNHTRVLQVLNGMATEELAEKLGSANLSVRLANFEVIVCLKFCHPDRSEAQWRDLRCAFPFSNSREFRVPL
jgi:hypothetical protein